MNSLVQYASSDSGSESDTESGSRPEATSTESAPVSNLLKSLPAPQSQSSFPSISSLLAKRDKNGKAVISVPEAPDSDSDDDSQPAKKKKKPLLPPAHSSGGSGPMSLLLKSLPAPKHQPKVIPASAFLKKKDSETTFSAAPMPSKPKVAGELREVSSSVSSAATPSASIPDNTRSPQQEAPGVYDPSPYSSSAVDPTAFESSAVHLDYGSVQAEPDAYLGPTPPAAADSASSSLQDMLSDERFKRLNRGGKHGQPDFSAIAENIIDVDENDRAQGYSGLPSKYVSVEKATRMPQSQQPSRTQKNKHQITYLAFQAKERELELRNQWAENRQTRKQTQGKYGF